jgi:hypothetical protein
MAASDTLTEQERDSAYAFFTKTLKLSGCPACQSKKNLNLHGRYLLVEHGPDGTSEYGTGAPVIALHCSTCHHIMLFAARPILDNQSISTELSG